MFTTRIIRILGTHLKCRIKTTFFVKTVNLSISPIYNNHGILNHKVRGKNLKIQSFDQIYFS